MTECVVCFEETSDQTKCGHLLCGKCRSQLTKPECPYCRQVIKTWEYQTVQMPFYYFTEFFYEHYRKNSRYYYLRMGYDYKDILQENGLYIFPNPMGNCPFTENFEKLITLRVFDIFRDGTKMKVEFATMGLDNERSRHYYTIKNETGSFDCFSYWICQNRNLRRYWNAKRY